MKRLPESITGALRHASACTALVVLGIAPQMTARAAGPTYGISFSFLNVDESRVAQCATVSRGATIRNSVFITRYDQPPIRERVRESLAGMRNSGFRDIRLIVYFGPDAKSGDWFDFNQGERAGALVRRYIEDVKAAGFEEMFLAFGVQGTGSPICRKDKWGDCYDSTSTKRASEFMVSVRKAIGTPTPLPMRFDLALELCSPPDLPQPMRGHLLDYTKSVISHYLRQFPNDTTTMSCSLARFHGGRKSIDDSYAAAGAVPAFYDIHYYNQPTQDEAALLRQLNADTENSRTPIVIGETTYGDAGNLQALMQSLVTPSGKVPAIYFWPLKDHPSRCHVDVAPPYTLESAKGR